MVALLSWARSRDAALVLADASRGNSEPARRKKLAGRYREGCRTIVADHTEDGGNIDVPMIVVRAHAFERSGNETGRDRGPFLC
ncbi:MAG: hypothetical protein FHP92_20690 [Denitromonas halophila]|nr:MAG: hypothetical protein FHP92_20690 [Denitromonas halophila]